MGLNVLDETTVRHSPEAIAHARAHVDAFVIDRMLDVSSFAGAAHWWGGAEPFEQERAHTAMADIHESLAEPRYLRERVFAATRQGTRKVRLSRAVALPRA